MADTVSAAKDDGVENLFDQYDAATKDKATLERCRAIEAAAKVMARVILANIPDSPERNLAIHRIQHVTKVAYVGAKGG